MPALEMIIWPVAGKKIAYWIEMYWPGIPRRCSRWLSKERTRPGR